MLYYPFIEPDTRMAKNRKAFKRFFSALSAQDKTIKCQNKISFVRIRCNLIVKVGKLGMNNGGASECKEILYNT